MNLINPYRFGEAPVPLPNHWWDLDDDGVWVDQGEKAAPGWDLSEGGTVTTVSSTIGGGGSRTVLDMNTVGYLEFDNGGTKTVAYDGTGEDMSVACWVNYDAVGSTLGAVIYWRDAVTSDAFQLFIQSTGEARFIVFNNGNNTNTADATTVDTLSTNTWYHLCGTFDSSTGTAKVYINGELKATVVNAVVNTLTATAAPFTLGTPSFVKGSTSQGYDGKLHAAGIWETTLTQEQVRGLYRSGDGGAHAEINWQVDGLWSSLAAVSSTISTWSGTGNTVYTRRAAHGEAANAFNGGVLMPDGKVCLVPAGSLYVGEYDPDTLTYTRRALHGEGANAFNGGVLMPDGKVCLVPRGSAYVGEYDPVALTYTRRAAHGEGSNVFIGGVVMPDGKVCLVPFGSSYVGEYDPVALTYTRRALTGEASFSFRAGVLMPDGKVCLVPSDSLYVGEYDPVALTYTRRAAHGEGSSAFASGVLMPDGKVCLVPLSSTYVGEYDSGTLAYTRRAAHGEGAFAFIGGVLMPNGKVCLAPLSSSYVGEYDGGGVSVPLNIALSPVLNKF